MQNIPEDNEFLSSEYEAEIKSLPFAQILNDKRKSDCGFFITVENLGAANWQIAEDQHYFTAIWRTGEETPGLLLHHPRLIILAQSPLLMFERSTGLNLGIFDPDYYRRAKQGTVLKTKYLVYFVDQNNQPRHQLPMQLTMKGAVGASFGEHLRQFRSELEKAFAAACKRPPQRRSDKFHAMGVFCIATEPQLRGEGQESHWICTTVSHQKPTANNVLDYFVGFTELKQRIEADLEQNADFGQVRQMTAVADSTLLLPQLSPVTPNSDDEIVARNSLFSLQPTVSATPASVNYTSANPTTQQIDVEDGADIPF